jgi:HD-like signal output (HDOD) protein
VQLNEKQILVSPLISPEIRQRRKSRVGTVLAEGLPALPTYAIQLNSLLSSPEVDLKKVTQIVRTDPSLCAQILGLANSALFNLRRRVLAVPEAVVLLGSERLRTLVLSCAFMKFAGRQLDSDELREFWRHSLLTAMLSERIARRVEYPEAEQAYTAGLLHDIGELPLLIVAHEEEGRSDAPLAGWRDVPAVEREYFGIDHPEVLPVSN